MRPSESFVEQPIRDLQTMLRVLAIEDNRLPKVVPDGIYGPATTNAVAAFQRLYGIPVTGVTDQRTWELIVDMYEESIINIGKAQPIEALINPGSVFRLGDKDPYIYLLQSMLTQLSIDHPSIPTPTHTGMIDSSTADSIGAFQLLAGLPVTNELDRKTWKFVVLQFVSNVHHNNANNLFT